LIGQSQVFARLAGQLRRQHLDQSGIGRDTGVQIVAASNAASETSGAQPSRPAARKFERNTRR